MLEGSHQSDNKQGTTCGHAQVSTTTSGYVSWGDFFINQALGTPDSAKALSAQRYTEPVCTANSSLKPPLHLWHCTHRLQPQLSQISENTQISCKGQRDCDISWTVFLHKTSCRTTSSYCNVEPNYMCWTTVMPLTSVVICRLTKDKTLLCKLQQLEPAS